MTEANVVGPVRAWNRQHRSKRIPRRKRAGGGYTESKTILRQFRPYGSQLRRRLRCRPSSRLYREVASNISNVAGATTAGNIGSKYKGSWKDFYLQPSRQ